MANFDIRNWKKLNESSGQTKRMTEDEKKETLEAVSMFNEYSKSIYKTTEISEMIENIKKLSENASKMAIEETADWFDVVSVKRDTKAIGESVKVFESTFKEISTLQQRLESVFEDIGGKLSKYYEIKELNETEAQDKYQAKFKSALDDEGVDSPAELDDEEKKAFFNKIDKMHKAKDESVNEGLKAKKPNQKATIDVHLVGDESHIVNPIKNKFKLKISDSGDVNREYSLTGKKKDILDYLQTHYGMPAADIKKNYPQLLEGVDRFKNQVNEAFEGLSNVISPSGYAINMSRKTKNINEGFETWEMSFAPMNLSGVELRPEKKYKVSARTTIEAIKKAAKMAGLKGNDWMATVTNTLKKL